MKGLRLNYTVLALSRVLCVSESGYYAWVDRPLSSHDWEELTLELEIGVADERTRHTLRTGAATTRSSGVRHKSGCLPDQSHPEETGHSVPAEAEVQGHHVLCSQAAGSQ